jgi:S-adenosylmethionine-diacylglycerol 3-amino-3-carboxypropyl transferase
LSIFTGSRRRSRTELAAAVHQNPALSQEGRLERLFTWMFSDLVYAQIWEDPVVDMDALSIGPSDHVVAIASGGCNVASYLAARPARITALDLNAAHVALNRLKLEAIRSLPGHAALRRFFADAAHRDNAAAYQRHIAPKLDATTRAYWEGRTLSGRRRIDRFGHGFYRYGLLGAFIGAAHAVARLHGHDLRRVLAAGTMAEQKTAYERHIAPLFEKRLVRWLAGKPASLYGLGIPPAQYRALAADHPDGVIGALRQRVERLATAFPLSDNYFAWQAFGRSYGAGPSASTPLYLQADAYQRIRDSVDRVDVRHMSLTTYLARSAAQSVDCYVLLDAQDWMNDADLNALWAQISRTARPRARVIFRTAADELLLPGRVSPDVLGAWARNDARSAALHLRDRSAIYGGFHLYELMDSRT